MRNEEKDMPAQRHNDPKRCLFVATATAPGFAVACTLRDTLLIALSYPTKNTMVTALVAAVGKRNRRHRRSEVSLFNVDNFMHR